MKAIVIAAGMGRRLMPYTDKVPKCLVPVRGRPILMRQIEAFRSHGVGEIVVIRGHRAEALDRADLGTGVHFVENSEYESNNILQSLFKARQHLSGPLCSTYGDIVFASEVVEELLASPGDICLVIDRDFAKVYEGRNAHPLAEAEVAAVDDKGRVTAVGKRAVPPDQAWGEFIGLCRFSAAGTRALCEAYDALAPRSPAFPRNSWAGAYLTDLFEVLIQEGFPITAMSIRGRWREIDTTEDLQRAEQAVDW